MKFILVGDCHSTPASKNEVENLLDMAAKLYIDKNCDGIILLGDLFDTHQHVNLEVSFSYLKVFNKHADIEWILIPGNHDHSVHGSRLEHALIPFKICKNVKIFDAPDGKVQNYKGIDFAPFIRTEEEFLELCSGKASELLICHQEFDGAEYENGFFAKHGTKFDNIPYKKIISGHIHKPNQVGPCFYIGAPRWLKTSDANQARFIYLLNDNKITAQFDTRSVCKMIYKYQIEEGSELPEVFPNGKYIIEAKGTATFLDKINSKYAGKAEVRGILEYQRDVSIKESVGIEKALEKFILEDYTMQYTANREKLWEKVKESLREY